MNEARKWYLTQATISTSRGPQKVIVASGPIPGEFERVEVTETGDASGGVKEPIVLLTKEEADEVKERMKQFVTKDEK
jgi:hypothetical protein